MEHNAATSRKGSDRTATDQPEGMRVLIPQRPRSVHYHRPGCGNLDAGRAAELAREDAETLGYRAHTCITGHIQEPDPDREVPA